MENSATILYVEDNPDNRLLVRRILQAEGFMVAEASNASEAEAWLQNDTPDLILMDISMPDVDGFTLTARLKQIPRFDHVPIIALTANVMRGDRDRTFEAGCDGYIPKPIDVDGLPRIVSEYLLRGTR